jgi:hypothetical protein
MKRWLPHIHFGDVSSECVNDEEGGREGRYFEVCWFGFMVGVTFSSLWAERRRSARFRKRYGGGAA